MKKPIQISIVILAGFLSYGVSFAQGNMEKEWTIKFGGYETKLSKKVGGTIDSIASGMKAYPDSNFVVSGCVTCNSRINSVIWDRVNNVIAYFVSKHGINGERFIFRYDESAGNCGEIVVRATSETVPAMVAPPHPNLRKKAGEIPCPPNSASNY